MRLQDHLPSGVRIPGLLVVSVLALLLTAGFVLASVFTVFNASVEPSVESKEADVVSSLLANNRVLDRSKDRFTGRSIFYIPKAPQEPRRPAPERPRPTPSPVETQAPPAPLRIPASYAGPNVTGVLGRNVFFDNGERIAEGEAAAGVKVLLIRGPFNLRLGWSGGEYDVSLFGDLPDYFSSVPFADGSRSNLFSSESSATSTSGMSSSSARNTASRRESDLNRSELDGVDERIQAARAREQRNRPSASAEAPPPVTDSELEEMSRVDAARALSKVNSALRSSSLDNETKSRLESDRKRLETHIRAPSNPDAGL